MKYHIAGLLIILSVGFAFSQSPVIEFDNKVMKFKKVKEGTPVELKFSFTNVGNAPLTFNKANTSCECTTVKFPENPVKPAERDTVYVSFDTKGKMGYQERKIELISNGDVRYITFKGSVIASKETKESIKAAD